MQRQIILVAVIVGLSSCGKKIDLKNTQHKTSYALGVEIANNMKSSEIDLDPEIMAMAMKDVFSEKKLKLTDEELKQTFFYIQDLAQQKLQIKSIENKKKSVEFLEKNKSITNMKISKSGLQYVILKEGKGKTPTAKSTVKMHYVGTLLDGTKFDSTYDRNQPLTLKLDQGIKAWSEGLQYMKAGGRYKLYVPPDLGYGPQGSPSSRIPPNSLLVYDIEILDIR